MMKKLITLTILLAIATWVMAQTSGGYVKRPKSKQIPVVQREKPSSKSGIKVFHSETFEYNGLSYRTTYNLNEENIVSVSSIPSNAPSGTLVIPDTIIHNEVNYTVRYIDSSAFEECKDITSVSVPNTIEGIGRNAFNGCTGLQSMTIPGSVRFIGSHAFYSCSQLHSLICHDGLEAIGAYAFVNCPLIHIVLPNTLKDVDYQYDIFGNINIEEPLYTSKYFFRLPSTWKGAYQIPNGIEVICNDAFAGCRDVTSIEMPNSVSYINSKGIKQYGISGKLTKPVFNETIFAQMSSYHKGSYVIPSGIKTICSNAFSNQPFLTSITIPTSVETIGDGCFRDTPMLATIKVEDGNPFYDSRGNCNAIIEKKDNKLIAGCKNTVIPLDTKIIGTGAFWFNAEITDIIIPNSVQQIESYAFVGTKLETIFIPDSVLAIGNCVFDHCQELKSVSISSSLIKNIYKNVFNDCDKLEFLTVRYPDGNSKQMTINDFCK